MKSLRTQYTTPYLTCISCNEITFIDTVAFQYGVISEETLKHTSGKHTLIVCPSCNKSDSLQIGAYDAEDLVNQNSYSTFLENIQRCSASIIIQRSFRFYLARLHGRSVRHVIAIEQIIHNHCASVIQSMYRMKKAIHRLEVEKAIQVIKSSPKHLLNYATNHELFERSVFWFETEEEICMLFFDYYTLVKRVGNHYGISEIEENLQTISKRILDRATQLAIKIQAHWRGTSMRLFFWGYRRQCIQSYEEKVHHIIKIQQSFRGWKDRRKAQTKRLTIFNRDLLHQYKCERREKFQMKEMKFMKDQVKKLYKQEVKERQMAKYMGINRTDDNNYQFYSKLSIEAIKKLFLLSNKHNIIK